MNLPSVSIHQPQALHPPHAPSRDLQTPSVTFSNAQADCVPLPKSLPTVEASKQTWRTPAPHTPEDPFSSLPLPSQGTTGMASLLSPASWPSQLPPGGSFSAKFSLPACLLVNSYLSGPVPAAISALALSMPEQAQGGHAGQGTCVLTLGRCFCFPPPSSDQRVTFYRQ